MQEKTKVKKMRHGVGIQLFYRPDDSIMCKYEGHWKLGKRHGLFFEIFKGEN